MAYRVVWSPKAVEDVEAIATYISRDSPSYASAVVQKLINQASRLSDSPSAETLVPECCDPKMHETCAYSYRMIYHINENRVTVAAIIHHKNLLSINH